MENSELRKQNAKDLKRAFKRFLNAQEQKKNARDAKKVCKK